MKDAARRRPDGAPVPTLRRVLGVILLHYDRKTVWKEIALGAAGTALALWFLAMVPMMTFFGFVFIGLVALFGGYLVRSLRRWGDTVGYDDIGVETRRRRIAWGETRKLDLRFYSTSRAGRRRGLGLTTSVDYHQVAAAQAQSAPSVGQGWLQLTIEGPDARIVIDSHLERFDEILRYCAAATERQPVEASETTQQNFKALGFPLFGAAPAAS